MIKSFNELMNHKHAYRTAPATPGLSNVELPSGRVSTGPEVLLLTERGSPSSFFDRHIDTNIARSQILQNGPNSESQDGRRSQRPGRRPRGESPLAGLD